jgi:hypothetical protein
MKKVIVVFLVLVVYALSFATANTVIAGDAPGFVPNNIKIIKLGTCNSGAYDTLASIGGAPHVHGPYALSPDGSRPQYAGFKITHPANAWDAGDTLSFQYQTLSSFNVKDTVSLAWKTIRLLVDAVDTLPYVSLAAYPGASIVFKITNMDVTAALIQNPIRVVFFGTSTESVDTKH